MISAQHEARAENAGEAGDGTHDMAGKGTRAGRVGKDMGAASLVRVGAPTK